jgi:hypothetical protein
MEPAVKEELAILEPVRKNGKQLRFVLEVPTSAWSLLP